MFRTLLIMMVVAAIPFLIYSGFRRQFGYALSVTATVFLIVIGIRVISGPFLFRTELENTIGAIGLTAIVAVAAYTVLRYYSGRVVERKLEERRQHPEAHRSLLENVRRVLKL